MRQKQPRKEVLAKREYVDFSRNGNNVNASWLGNIHIVYFFAYQENLSFFTGVNTQNDNNLCLILVWSRLISIFYNTLIILISEFLEHTDEGGFNRQQFDILHFLVNQANISHFQFQFIYFKKQLCQQTPNLLTTKFHQLSKHSSHILAQISLILLYFSKMNILLSKYLIILEISNNKRRPLVQEIIWRKKEEVWVCPDCFTQKRYDFVSHSLIGKPRYLRTMQQGYDFGKHSSCNLIIRTCNNSKILVALPVTSDLLLT